MGKTIHRALDVNTNQAVAWSADHPGWWIFPGRMVADGSGGWIKRPLVAWTKKATKDPEEVRRLWDSVGGHAVVCVACEPSGIFIIDEDRDVEDATWKSLLDMVRTAKRTLVLRSATKGRPHYVFRQPATGDPVAEGRWHAGDIKSSGMIMLSSHDPIVDAPVREAPKGIIDMLKRGPKGSRGRGLASYEALNNWLATTPEMLILGESAQEKFLERTVAKMAKDVNEEGQHRRTAALNAVYHAAHEAAAGCYPADNAYKAIQDEYETLRSGDSDPTKGWTPARISDYQAMWASLVPEFVAGDHDDEIQKIRDDVFERFGEEDEDDFEDLADWFDLLINADAAAALRGEEPVAVPPVDSPAHESPAPIKSNTPGQNGKEPGFKDPEPLLAPVVDSEPEELSPEIPNPSPEPPSGVDPETGEVKATPLLVAAPMGGSYEVLPIEKLPVKLAAEAYLGPHGEFIEAARRYTESGDPGLLAVSLAATGAYYGKTAQFRRGGAIHGPNVFVLGVGESAATRKTTSWASVRPVFFPPTGPPLIRPQMFSNVGSGERLLHFWEPVETTEVDPSTGSPATMIEPAEPRALWYESEISAMFKRTKREGATMSETVCQLWDQDTLEHWIRTGPDISVPASAYRCSVIGLTTLDLIRLHVTSAEAGTGLGNRFLWFYLTDTGETRDLPDGGTLPDPIVAEYRRKLNLDAITFGEVEVDLTPNAKVMWRETYGKIKRGQKGFGMVESLLNRGEPYVLRIALNYHLAMGRPLRSKAGTNEVVDVDCLTAALAVWDYCRASVRTIFKDTSGDPTIDEIVFMLRQDKGWMYSDELRLAGLGRTALQRGLDRGILVAGRYGNMRGRTIVGVKAMVDSKQLVVKSEGEREKLKWL